MWLTVVSFHVIGSSLSLVSTKEFAFRFSRMPGNQWAWVFCVIYSSAILFLRFFSTLNMQNPKPELNRINRRKQKDSLFDWEFFMLNKSKSDCIIIAWRCLQKILENWMFYKIFFCRFIWNSVFAWIMLQKRFKNQFKSYHNCSSLNF